MTDTLPNLPPGYTLRFDEERTPSVTPKWFDPAHWEAQGALTGQALGRGTTHFFKHRGREYVLRHYRRGGLIGKLVKDQYLFTGLHNTRAWRECDLLNALQHLDLPAPRPIAALVVRKGLLYRADLICERIPDATDVHTLLMENKPEHTLWQKIGATIRRFHDHQVYHHDLNIHNIMCDGSGSIWLIDFDKCDRRKGQSWKQANLARLHRSLQKELGRCAHYHFDREDWVALLEGYTTPG